METKQLSFEGCEVKLLVTASKEEFDKQFNKELRRVAADKKFKVPGFRPGKVPADIVVKHRGSEVNEKALNYFRNTAINDYIANSEVEVLSLTSATVGYQEEKLEEFLHLELTLEVIKPLDVSDCSFINVKRPLIDPDEAVEEMVLALRQQRSTRVAHDGPAEVDDLVTFTSTAKDDAGLEFEALTSDTPRTFVIGEYQTPEAFSHAFSGKKVGETFTFTYIPPQAEGAEEQSYEVTATLTGIQRRVLPEVDENFVSEFIGRKGDLDELRQDIRKNIVREIKLNVKRFIEPQVMNQFVEKFSDIELPANYVSNRAAELKEQYRQYVLAQVKQVPGLADTFDVNAVLEGQDFNKQAKTSVISQQVLKALATKVTVTPEEVEDFIKELSIMFETPEQFIEQVKADENEYRKHVNEVVQAKIMEHVLEQANVVDEPMSYTALVRIINARLQQ